MNIINKQYFIRFLKEVETKYPTDIAIVQKN